MDGLLGEDGIDAGLTAFTAALLAMGFLDARLHSRARIDHATLRRAMRHIAAVDVGDAGHCPYLSPVAARFVGGRQ